MRETDVIKRLRSAATHPAARDLRDDVALLDGLVITHDSIAEGVHFLVTDPPASIGWKLVAVNLSDLAAKGATPEAALLSFCVSGDEIWDSAFLDGVEAACESYGLPLIGGDTIAVTSGQPRIFGMTAIGRAGINIPDRRNGAPGDRLWLIGTLGDSAAGLAQLAANPAASGPLVDIYRRPIPQLAAGLVVAPEATAMMDISDGLLLDAARLAEASGCSASIDLASLPLSEMFRSVRGDDREARLFAATGGDDYSLLAAIPDNVDPLTLSLPEGTKICAIGKLSDGDPILTLVDRGEPVPLPEHLGHEHSGGVDPAMADCP